MTSASADGQVESIQLDLDRPAPARIYNYLLGGSHNYAVDRHLGDQLLSVLPTARVLCREMHAWTRRAVRYGLEQGVRQFLHIGPGMISEGHIHEVAQAVAPESRVVYADSEPVTIAHSKLILEGNDNADIVQARLGRPAEVLTHPVTLELIDFDEPVMVISGSLLHFVPDEREPAKLVAEYRERISPGSYLALCTITAEQQDERLRRGMDLFETSSCRIHLRGRKELSAMLAGLDLIEPGVVFTTEWRPDRPVGENPERSAVLAGVARKR